MEISDLVRSAIEQKVACAEYMLSDGLWILCLLERQMKL
jgi:hypothetical protein